MTTLAPGRAGTAARWARFRDRPVRNTLLAAASLMVLTVAVLFLVGSQGATAVTFKVASRPSSVSGIVVYGKVTNESQQAVSSLKVQFLAKVHGRMRVIGQTKTTSAGVYRVEFRRYSTVFMHVKIQGTNYDASTQFRANRGDAYKVLVHLIRRASVFFLPVSSY